MAAVNPTNPLPSVLLIEDDATLATALTLRLSPHASITHVDSTTAAKARLAETQYNLVLTDFELPDGNGLEVIQWMHAGEIFTPTIMLTGRASKDLVISTVKYRIFGFLEKPLNPDEVEGLVLRALESQELNRRKDKFAQIGEIASQLTHEIATPLAIINLQAENLDPENVVGKVEEHDYFKKAIGAIQKSAKRIENIVSDTRDRLRSSSEYRVAMDNHTISEIIGVVQDQCTMRANRKSVSLYFSIAENSSLLANKTQLAQAIINLVNNAVDAVEHLQERWVRLETARVGASLKVTVTDSGAGIPENVQQKLFSQLFTTKAQTGTGLGLSIVKRVAVAHGGTIQLNKESKHTQFILTLPLTNLVQAAG